MDRIKKAALLLKLIDKLHEKGSWCGETHIQKATFFLQELMKVPTGFDFILYKHGPFSFDLRDELTALRADSLIGLEPHWPYGPRIVPKDLSEYIQKTYSKTLTKYENSIDFVAKKLGNQGVADLERLATALYVTLSTATGTPVNERAQELTRLKPHIAPESAQIAMEEIDKIINEVKMQIN
jgi:hypothetical protein